MGNKDSKPKDLKELKKSTHLSEKKITEWYKGFCESYPSGHVTREQFQSLYKEQFPHGDSTEFADNVFRTFDKDGDQLLDFREFMLGLSVTSSASEGDQLTWAFEMYDLDKNGYIDMNECTQVVKGVLKMYAPGCSQASDEEMENNARSLSEKIFSTTDKDKDGKLSRKEFIDGARTDKTLMSMIGGQPIL